MSMTLRIAGLAARALRGVGHAIVRLADRFDTKTKNGGTPTSSESMEDTVSSEKLYRQAGDHNAGEPAAGQSGGAQDARSKFRAVIRPARPEAREPVRVRPRPQEPPGAAPRTAYSDSDLASALRIMRESKMTLSEAVGVFRAVDPASQCMRTSSPNAVSHAHPTTTDAERRRDFEINRALRLLAEPYTTGHENARSRLLALGLTDADIDARLDVYLARRANELQQAKMKYFGEQATSSH